jgi:hypothetical protein
MLFPGEETKEVNMRIPTLMALTLAGLACLDLIIDKVASAAAPPEIPNVVGEWKGTSETVVFGSSPHHPDSAAPADKARLREVEFTMTVEGQEGRRFWGKNSSAVHQPTLRGRVLLKPRVRLRRQSERVLSLPEPRA